MAGSVRKFRSVSEMSAARAEASSESTAAENLVRGLAWCAHALEIAPRRSWAGVRKFTSHQSLKAAPR